MPTMEDMRLGGTPFDPFLHATVGKDLNGNAVTMLSTLARLGLEPWEAASKLASVTPDEAFSHLESLLAGFGDVPALKDDHAAITRSLLELLPRTARRLVGPNLPGSGTPGRMDIGLIVVALIIALYLVRSLLPAAGG